MDEGGPLFVDEMPRTSTRTGDRVALREQFD
jgi:hypothetical protein